MLTNKDFIRVSLTTEELTEAHAEADRQEEESRKKKRKQGRNGQFSPEESLEVSQGLVGEYPVSKYFNEPREKRKFKDRLKADVGDNKPVKTIDKLYGPSGRPMNLLVPPDHLQDDETYILVVGDYHNRSNPDFDLVGYMSGKEVREVGKLGYYGHPERPKAYGVLWTKLHPISELKANVNTV